MTKMERSLEGTEAHLGGHYPFYWVDNPREYSLSFERAVNQVPDSKRYIDPIGVLQMLASTYLLGDRTLLVGLARAPWMGRLGPTGWKRGNIPPHGTTQASQEDISKTLLRLLRTEMLQYVGTVGRVGILLSGGLDSRIAAGVLRELQEAAEFRGDVVALTWGLENSRDVRYAQEIARRFGWDWIHFPSGPDMLFENIRLAAVLGAEFSPLHLHAMSQIRSLQHVDVIVAGSYGDSVGRAEYSGRHVTRTLPIIPSDLDRFRLLRQSVVASAAEQVREDAHRYRVDYPRDMEYQYRELEQQMHYMRRKLQACMSYVSEKIPVYQLFTAPATFGYMWSLDPKCRGNGAYEMLIPLLPGNLGAIPWARTGKTLHSAPSDPADELSKEHHRYGQWLRNDLREAVHNLVTSSALMDLRLFNEASLERLLQLWPLATTVSTSYVDEVVAWLAALSILVERYSVRSSISASYTWQDRWNSVSGPARALTYQVARGLVRA